MRNTKKSVFKVNLLTNKTMLLAFGAGLLLQIAVTEIPFLCAVFDTEQLTLTQWGQVLVFAVIPLVIHEIIVFIRWVAGKGK